MEKIHLDRLEKQFVQIDERGPDTFEKLLGIQGVGPKSLRALTLISELVYGIVRVLRIRPIRFAHGGKDGHPYPVDRKVYDRTIEVLRTAVERAKVGDREKVEAIQKATILRPITGTCWDGSVDFSGQGLDMRFIADFIFILI